MAAPPTVSVVDSELLPSNTEFVISILPVSVNQIAPPALAVLFLKVVVLILKSLKAPPIAPPDKPATLFSK